MEGGKDENRKTYKGISAKYSRQVLTRACIRVLAVKREKGKWIWYLNMRFERKEKIPEKKKKKKPTL